MILITSGPTREYIDPVRYLSNASSGQMGAALAQAVLNSGDIPVVVSGPVAVDYPHGTEIHRVVTTEEMLQVSQKLFSKCDGLIAAAAPCDFRPESFSPLKISKSLTSAGISIELTQTPDIVAALAANKNPNQWIVAFALETHEHKERALRKLKQKGADFIVLNGPETINSSHASIEILNKHGETVGTFSGAKIDMATRILDAVRHH